MWTLLYRGRGYWAWLAPGVVSEEERTKVLDADEIRNEVIQVDAFDPEEFLASRG